MVKDPTSRRLDELIGGTPAHRLRDLGFKKRGRNFHRLAGELTHSVWFQTMRGGPGVFCVNLTVLFSTLHEVAHGRPLPASPSLLNSVPLATRRVGWATEEGPQHWFVLGPETDSSALAGEVWDRLEAELSWLDGWPTVDAALERYEAGPPFDEGSGLDAGYRVQYAVLLACRGQPERALALLSDEAARADAPDFYAAIERRLRDSVG